MKQGSNPSSFSDKLESWLSGGGPKTVAGLEAVFAEKSLVLLIVLLMALPALPLPTGGITHVFEIIATLLALELIVGVKSIWLPRRWRHANVSGRITKGAIPQVVKLVRRYERWSTPRGKRVFAFPLTDRLAGLVLLVLVAAAFLAPPFTGLDTLPSLGAVMVGLALILEDLALLIAGLAIGIAGVGLVVALGGLTLTLVHRWL
jgi:hypothetical protein